MKKVISLFLCAILLLSFAAIGQAESAQYAVTEPITIEFWDSYGEPEKSAWMQAAVKAFNESQALVTVEYRNIAGYGAMDEQLAGAQAAQKGLPGIAFINFPRVQTYAASGMVEPLNEYVKATGFDIEDINAGMLDALTANADGLLYGMPLGVSSACVFWNMDLLKQIGVDKLPDTWDELVALAPVIQEKTGKTAFGIMSELNYMDSLIRNTGADVLGDGTYCNLMDENIVSLLKAFKGMIDANQARLYTGTTYTADIMTDFTSGNLVCMCNTIAVTNNVAANSNFEVVTSFMLKNKVEPAISTAAGAAIIIPALNDQAVKNAAWQFASFLLSKDNVKDWSFVSSTYPVRVSIYSDASAMAALYATQPLYENIYAGLDGVVSKNKTPLQTSSYKILLAAIGKYFYDNADFDTEMKNAVEEVNYLLSDN